jgi:hypothetical protein
MRIKLIGLLCLSAFVVAILGLRAHLAQTSIASLEIKNSNLSLAKIDTQIEIKQSEKIDTANNIITDQNIDQKNHQSIESEELKLQEIYKKQAIVLATAISHSGLNVDQLNEMASELSFEDFLKNVPQNLRAHYATFHKAIESIQKYHMKRDGMPQEFFGKYQVTPPAWILERHQILQKVELPAAVSELVESKKGQQSLENEDVAQILKLCGRGAKDCIERAFVSLIDANHSITEFQQNQIEQYLL